MLTNILKFFLSLILFTSRLNVEVYCFSSLRHNLSPFGFLSTTKKKKKYTQNCYKEGKKEHYLPFFKVSN